MLFSCLVNQLLDGEQSVVVRSTDYVLALGDQAAHSAFATLGKCLSLEILVLSVSNVKAGADRSTLSPSLPPDSCRFSLLGK